MLARKKQMGFAIEKVKRDIDNGKHDTLKSGKRIWRIKPHDERNVLFKGYPRRCKLERIMRYGRLTIMGLRSS